ncbi:hypothetical protein GCM10011391_00230 [Pullulanibacillus camelliae]|uniref:Uncharacterized protein n=1 Tax=Pullulanibacillus camelliae TaxID=1707096 RepID=A0A8J2VDD9_9BACL|nr:hypothetical protein [Pullulanibacillus camelliae]GGE25800.1 hypothetical protein GCM10011391_00230 [Pullulanibacillus camelliae]
MTIGDKEGFIIDRNGAAFRGEHLIEGAVQTIFRLHSLNKRIVFLSN